LYKGNEKSHWRKGLTKKKTGKKRWTELNKRTVMKKMRDVRDVSIACSGKRGSASYFVRNLKDDHTGWDHKGVTEVNGRELPVGDSKEAKNFAHGLPNEAGVV
jgi:hypothetical protein